ncbi:MAG TPA: heparinase II/III family protein [Lacunisphaera sp.]|nr:heparinase II/III family protein [Lacunisphaera sp.]
MRFLPWLLTGLILAAKMAAADPLATLRPEHPRLLFTQQSLGEAIAAARADPLREKLHRHVIRTAEEQMKEPPIRHVLVGPRMLDQSRKALGQVTTCAMAWRLTGDARFADFARDVMLTAAAFPDWNPSHFLDVAEMATALGLGYDWLYDRMTPAERATIKRALLDKALAYAKPAYARADPDRESFPFVKGNLTNNWNQVCNGGFLIAALAIAEDEPELARAVIAGLRETLPVAMAAYQPDGAYPEGPVYWGYGTRFNVIILAALETALGDAFGLDRLAGFDRTELFRVHIQSPTGLSFNFADGRAGLGADSGLTWLAQRHHQPAAEAHSRALLAAELEREPNAGDRFMATNVFWFPQPAAGDASLPLDVKFDGPSKIALMRSAWGDARALWTGLKAGSNRVNHGHLDLGSFMLDADGERWAVDLGPDNYNLPGYWNGGKVGSPRWQYFRLNNRSHNTLTPANVLQSPDADGRIIAFGSTPARAFAVADLSSAYPAQARRFQRGVALLDRSRVLVQDEVTGLKTGVPLTWRMLTPATVALAGRQATLTRNGRTLRVEILSPETARFATRPATPPTVVEEQNAGITELVAEVPAKTGEESDVRIAVLLTPVGDKWPARPAPTLEPLEEWK